MKFNISRWAAGFHKPVNKPSPKENAHLCLWCNSFFTYVQKIDFPVLYDEYVQMGKVPAISQRVLAARDSNAVYPHSPSLRDLRKAAREGCHVCRLFLSQLTASEHRRLSDIDSQQPLFFCIQLSLRIVRLVPSAPVRYGIHLKCLSNPSNLKDLPLEVESSFHDLAMLSTHDKTCNSELWNARDRWSSAIATALYWIQECRNNHTLCSNPLLTSSKWPSRLILVGDNDGGVKICENIENYPCYVTLSHCWGPNGVKFKLINANKELLHKCLPVSELTSTFQDAINFTRKLKSIGVDYLWIDALCIIQDSKDDWVRESAIMGDIYGNGICNLAASTGSDGTSGLFPISDPYFGHDCIIRAGDTSCLDDYFKIHNTDILCDEEKGMMRDRSITSRAWCVQELKLSKRVLYFARHQLLWDCRTIVAREQEPRCELDANVYEFRSRKQDTRYFSEEYLEQCKNFGIDRNPFMIYNQWMNVLSTYTSCDLTRHSDKLVAIAGIAKKVHLALGSDEQYIGGLWTRYLHLHLLWNVTSNLTNFRYRGYRAPSWSWASAEGRIYNHRTGGGTVSSCTCLIRAKTEHRLATTDPYGALAWAILHVEGPLLKVRLGPRDLHQAFEYKVRSMTTESGMQLRHGSSPFSVDLDFEFPGTDPVDAYCLLAIKEVPPSRPPELAGLILLRQNSVEGQYIRVGLAFILPINLLQEARTQRLVDKSDYISLLDNGDYRISII